MEEGVGLLSPQRVEIGQILGNQIKLARKYELPNIKAFQKWSEQSMSNTKLAHIWGVSKENLDELHKGSCNSDSCIRWEGLDYTTHRSLSNPEDAMILCCKQRGKNKGKALLCQAGQKDGLFSNLAVVDMYTSPALYAPYASGQN